MESGRWPLPLPPDICSFMQDANVGYSNSRTPSRYSSADPTQIIPSATYVSDYHLTGSTWSHRGSREQSCSSRYATHKSGGTASSASYNSKYAPSQDKMPRMVNVPRLDRSGDEMKLMTTPTQQPKVGPRPTLVTSSTGHTLQAPQSYCILPDIFSPRIPESTPPPYSPSPNCVSSSEGRFGSSPRVPYQSPTQSASRTASSPPRYGERSKQGISVCNTGDIYSQIGMVPVVGRAPVEVRRTVMAASRESKRSKKQLKNYKSQINNRPPTRIEEHGITTEDDFGSELLEEIFTIGEGSKFGSTRGMFGYVGNKVSDA